MRVAVIRDHTHNIITYVFGDGRISTHADPIRPHVERFYERHIFTVMFTCGWAWPARWPICPILGFRGAKFTKMGDSLPWTPMNRRAKYGTASFLLGGEIRSRTNKQTKNTQTKSNLSTLPIGMCG